MIKLGELLDPDLLAEMLEQGYVRRQAHPSLPLSILNYSEKAAYEVVWNPVTLQCRGLIYNHDTEEIVARPLRKFFNWGQVGAPELDIQAPAIVTDKVDGSMGVTYPVPDGWAIATRGSFASEQAVHATEVLRTRYGSWAPPHGLSVVFEIVYPSNRVVCDYGSLDDLVLLGAVEIETGRTLPPAAIASWPGPVTETFEYATLAQALAAPPRPNAEGMVVHLLDSDDRIKIKYEEYVTLHKIVTGLTARTVWEHLLEGKPLAELIEPLPDEFHPWVAQIAGDILLSVQKEEKRLNGKYQSAVGLMPLGWDGATREGRKSFAMLAADSPDKWALFALLDGKDISGELLKRAKPEPYITPSGRIFTEDNA
jgi:RNA ligase